MPLMRNKAYDLGVDQDVKDPDLEDYLDAAERRISPGRVYRGGETLEASEPTFLLEGLVQLGETNIVVGQPKVGKSSFSCGLIAALRDRRETFLGRTLNNPSFRMPCLIFGTDQSEGNWLHFLKRERLVNEGQTIDGDALDFFCSIDSSDEYNFTKDGLRHMREVIEQHQFPLVIIDSLNSMMEPTGIEENNSRFAQPIRNAIRELRKTGATLVIIHHARKSPTTWDWIAECRGSSSISGVFSWGFLMRWVTQEEDGLARTDRRVGFAGKGRGSGESGGVMAEYLAEGGWTYLDGLEAAQHFERIRRRIKDLGGVRQQVFDWVTTRSRLGADESADTVASQLSKDVSACRRELKNLRDLGLVEICRKEGKKAYWMLTEPALRWATEEDFSRGSESVFSVPSVLFSEKDQKDRKEHFWGKGQPSEKDMSVGTPVELLRNDQWQNGWVVHSHDGLTITAAKTGDPNRLIKNLRPDLDVRPCSSPFQAPADSRPDVSGGDTPVPVQGSDDSDFDYSSLEF